MKRERITVLICLVLVTFCAAALTNTVHVSRRMTVITDQAIALTGEGGPDGKNLTKLDRKISEIDRIWEKLAPVVSTYSRHDELERVTSAVQRLRPLFESGQFDELYLTLHETKDALDHLRQTELPTIENIL